MSVFYTITTTVQPYLAGDPGIVRAEGPLQEVLRGVGEGVVRGYCSECQLAMPPLSHHCRLCVKCHHQMDHHCLFLNTCIASNNHWHFVVFVMTNLLLMVGFVHGAFVATMPKTDEGDWVERLLAHILYLLNENVWALLMIICNVVSFVWGFHLLKWVFFYLFVFVLMCVRCHLNLLFQSMHIHILPLLHQLGLLKVANFPSMNLRHLKSQMV